MSITFNNICGIWIGLAKVKINGKKQMIYSGTQTSKNAVIDSLFALIEL